MARSETADPLIGQYIGSYKVAHKLGEGGMGAVYEIVHQTIGRRAALKVLHPQYAAQPDIVGRFFAEARAVHVIRHPNIVDITNLDQLPDGRYYIEMEFLGGQSLGDLIDAQGVLAPREVADIIAPLCDALAAAHKAGVVHRDLKPDNIHLVPRPDNPRYVKVLDFGIAKLSTELKRDGQAVTRSNQVIGTPAYMSPEQAMGRNRQIDHRTDIYAVGVILYELLTGRVPFIADSRGDLMLKHLHEPPLPLGVYRPDLPPVWNDVVQIALAKQREQRFQSMEALAQAVLAAASGRPLPALAGHAVVGESLSSYPHRSAARRLRLVERRWFIPAALSAIALITVIAILLIAGG